MSEALFTTYRSPQRELYARLADQLCEQYKKRRANGPKCPACGNRARLDDGRCVTCAAVAARK
jgi:hypothetical protein